MSFDPSRSYSKTFPHEEGDPLGRAHAHAKEFLPSGTIYEIRSFDRRAVSKANGIKNNDRNDWRAGWYYEPEMQGKALDDATPTTVRGDGLDGDFLGRFLT